MFDISLFMLGMNFTVYLQHAYFIGALGSVMLVEIWAVPLLGLGVSIYREVCLLENLFQLKIYRELQ